MPLPRLLLLQSGAYDATYEAGVEPDGRWQTAGGSYVTRGRREGRLSRSGRGDLARLAAAVEAPRAYPVPAAAEGFTSELRIGEARVTWWGPPPTEPLSALVRRLSTLAR